MRERVKSIGIIGGGKLIAEGTPEELLERTGTGTLEDAFLALTGLDAPQGEVVAGL